jgi:hypothetical protein
MASKSEAAKARLAARVAAAPNEKVADIMAIEDPEERWEKLTEAGYCGYAAGSCRTDNGKVAKCEINERTGKPYRECVAHIAYAKAMNKKYERDGTTPKWRAVLKEVIKEAAEDPKWLQGPSGGRRRRRLRKK